MIEFSWETFKKIRNNFQLKNILDELLYKIPGLINEQSREAIIESLESETSIGKGKIKRGSGLEGIQIAKDIVEKCNYDNFKYLCETLLRTNDGNSTEFIELSDFLTGADSLIELERIFSQVKTDKLKLSDWYNYERSNFQDYNLFKVIRYLVDFPRKPLDTYPLVKFIQSCLPYINNAQERDKASCITQALIRTRHNLSEEDINHIKESLKIDTNIETQSCQTDLFIAEKLPVMARSLRVAPEYINKVKSALQRNTYASQKMLATEAGMSESTVKSFLKGNPVDYTNFIEVCTKLDFDWQEIAYKEPETQPTNQEKSPFITGTPITQPHYFFGREKELKRLFNLIKRHPLQNAAIIGKKRIGKTSLLHYLKNISTTPAEQLRLGQKSDWLPHPESYQWVFVDLQDARMQSREGLLKYILESLKMKVLTPCDLDHFMNELSGNLSSPTVILLDEIGVALQRCPELDDTFWESLRSLATNQTRGNLAFILTTPEPPSDFARNTGHSSPFFNIFGYTAYLETLTEPEARELIASSPIPFPGDDVEWILTQSHCHPFLLQILCRERLFTLEEGETNDNWQKEGLQQMKPFANLLTEK